MYLNTGARAVTYKEFQGMANPGVAIHGNSIRFEFHYKGLPRKEKFSSLKEVTTQADFERALAQANHMRETIRHLSEMGTLDDEAIRRFLPLSTLAKKKGAINVNFGALAQQYVESLEVRVKLASLAPGSAKTAKKIANSKVLSQDHLGCKDMVISRYGFNKLNVLETKPKSIQDFLDYLSLYAKKEDGSIGYSRSYINNLLDFIKQVFKFAISAGVIDVNPCLQVKTISAPRKKGRYSKQGDKQDFFTEEQQTLVYDQLVFDQKRWLAEMFKFGCWTGLRKEELLALAWEDIDLEARSIIVRRAYSADAFKDAKTELGVRELGLVKPAFESLIAMREFTEDLEAQIYSVQRSDERGWIDEELKLVFMNLSPRALGNGEYMPPRHWNELAIRNAWDRVKKQTEVNIPLSQVRHTYSSMCVSRGVPMDSISRTLGHASEQMLRQRYGKMDKSLNPELLKQVNRVFGFDDF